MHPIRCVAASLLLVAAAAAPASADVTLFTGVATEPSTRSAVGAALGFSLLVVGFELEYANLSEDAPQSAPRVRTGMGNLYLQTPIAISRMRPYFTIGAGGFHERLGDATETGFGTNVGAGVRISLVGPLRARLDYRRFSLRGGAQQPRQHRVYAGLNIAF